MKSRCSELYNNMSKGLGTGACKEYLESRISQEDGNESFVSSTSLLSALDLCLESNIFTFDEKIYRQVNGVGTGVKLAPTYACLGLGKYEEQMFRADQPLLERILVWKRFIDDVLMLFKGNEEQCQELVNWLNSLMPGVIKFKYDFSPQKIEFLDLEILIKNGRLHTNLFIKPTNKQLYLDFNSNHPNHCKIGIPYSQALRVVERCSTPINEEEHLVNLKEKLIDRNYPPNLVDKQFIRAKKNNRRDRIFQQRKRNKQDNKVRLILTHNSTNPPIHMWVRQCKKLLERNDQAKELGSQIQIGYKQPKNLLRMVGGYKTQNGGNPTPHDAGCSKCNHCKVSCPLMNETKIFKSTNTGKTYKIRQKLDCDSDWVIYLSTCNKCRGQYVGKSKTKFKVRHSNHKQEIRKDVGGLGHHYGSRGNCEYKDMRVTLIEQVRVKTLDFLAEREVWWQNQLRVYVQNSGKAHCYRKENVW